MISGVLSLRSSAEAHDRMFTTTVVAFFVIGLAVSWYMVVSTFLHLCCVFIASWCMEDELVADVTVSSACPLHLVLRVLQ